MLIILKVYDLLFERNLHLLNRPSALCKLSFAFVNDKLQEAEENNEETTNQVHKRWKKECFFRVQMTSEADGKI